MVYFDYKTVKPVILQGLGGKTSFEQPTDSGYHERYKQRNHEKLSLICKHIDSFKDLSILDVGCNAGFFSVELNKLGAFVNAIDLDKSLIEKAKLLESDTLKFHVADVEELLERNLSFNIVLFMSVYHHLINFKGLDKARDILNKLSKMCECLIFESGQRDEMVNFEWREKLPEEFSTPEDIFKELETYTNFEKFNLIGRLPIHSGNRNLFLCTR